MSKASKSAEEPEELLEVEPKIRVDTRLSEGEYSITHNIVIYKGATLTIAAGAHFQFAPETGIIIIGKLIARGNEQDPIVFTGKAGWCGLLFSGDAVDGSRIDYTEFTRGKGRFPIEKLGANGVPRFEKPGKARNISGGAISIHHTGSATLHFENVQFRANGGSRIGGAVMIDQGKANFISCSFESNRADAGGALAVRQSVITLQSCTFTGNTAQVAAKSGGALYVSRTTGSLESCKFINNSGLSGGALYCKSSPLQLKTIEFNENSAATNGGAIVCEGDQLPGLSNCQFIKNTATEEGGAIYFKTDHQKTLDLKEATFEDNSAGNQGGAICCAPGSTATLTDCGFKQNQSQNEAKWIHGGAVFCAIGSRFAFTSCRFESNNGKNGGAICLGDGDPLENENRTNATIHQSSFISNTAHDNGGALFLSPGSTLEIRNHCHFENNTANRQGGALATASHCNLLVLNSYFGGNVAAHGGAILWRGAVGQINENAFISNSATESGGAIECHSPLSLVQCRFRKNSTHHKGGGALWIADISISMERCEFENNETEGADEGGAVRYLIDSGNLQDNNTFGFNRPNSIRYNKVRYPDESISPTKLGKGGCWAVSAYFGDAAHPDVRRIRGMRDDLIDHPVVGPLVDRINQLYQVVGFTPFGRSWRSNLNRNQSTLTRLLTGTACLLLRHMASCYWRHRR